MRTHCFCVNQTNSRVIYWWSLSQPPAQGEVLGGELAAFLLPTLGQTEWEGPLGVSGVKVCNFLPLLSNQHGSLILTSNTAIYWVVRMYTWQLVKLELIITAHIKYLECKIIDCKWAVNNYISVICNGVRTILFLWNVLEWTGKAEQPKCKVQAIHWN